MAERSEMSPVMHSSRPGVGTRSKPRTAWPRRMSSATTAWPIRPEDPVTRTVLDMRILCMTQSRVRFKSSHFRCEPVFQYSLNASTIRGTPLLQQIEVAAKAGYRGIELWFADLDAHLASGGTIADARAALDDGALSVPTCIYLGSWFDAAEEEWP